MKIEKFDIDYIKDFINKHKESKIYLGVDSQRKGTIVKYATVVIIHYEGNHGAKIFVDLHKDNVKDSDLSKPFNRMMREVELIAELYAKLEDVLFDKDFEIHLDVNPEKGFGSNVAYAAARGYIWGVIGVEPVCKPHAFAASCAADKFSK